MRVMKRGESDYQPTVEMIAVKHGTVAGDAGIIHTDPTHSEKRHRELLVSEADAVLLEKRKLARRKTAEDTKTSGKRSGKVPAVETPVGGADDPTRSADAGAARVADSAGAEESTGAAASGLSTRDTTHHADGEQVRGEAREGELATGLDAADPTTPPVPARTGRQAAPAKTGN